MRLDTPEARKLEQIARVSYAAIKEYASTMGELLPEWRNLNYEDRMARISGVKFRAENSHLSPRKIHEKWCEEMIAAGWMYSPKTNPVAKVHSCLVDYDELPREQQIKDYLFSAIVNALTQPQEISIDAEDILNLLEKLRAATQENDSNE